MFLLRFLAPSWFTILFVALFALPSLATDVSRPAEKPVKVHVTILIIDVDGVTSADQSFEANIYFRLRWQDPRLAHKHSKEIVRPMKEVWNPEIQIVNQQKIWLTFPETVKITPGGEVTYRQRAWGSFSQPLKLHDFPFDRQRFSIQLAAVDSTPEDIELVYDTKMDSGMAEVLSVADWKILEWKAEPHPYEPGPAIDPLAGYVFTFEAQRETGYFVVKVIIPLFLIVAMSWVVFWIDPMESGTQISVAITTMLTLIAYRFATDTDLPKISYLTRLDFFILISTILVYASLIEVVVTSTLAKREKLFQARAIDRWMRWIFPAVFILVAIISLAF